MITVCKDTSNGLFGGCRDRVVGNVVAESMQSETPSSLTAAGDDRAAIRARLNSTGSTLDEYSLRQLPSGIYQLFVRNSCALDRGQNTTPEDGSACIDVKVDSVRGSIATTVIIRSATVFSTLSLEHGALVRFYGEMRSGSGEVFVVSVNNSGTDCLLRESAESGFRVLANRFSCHVKVTSAGVTFPVTSSSFHRATSVSHGPFSLRAVARDGVKTQVTCAGAEFELSSGISLSAGRIDSLKFAPRWTAGNGQFLSSRHGESDFMSLQRSAR